MIFGVQHSKIVSGINEILLAHSILYPDYSIPSFIERRSIVNGNIVFVSLGYYSAFKVMVYDWKGSSIFSDVAAYLHSNITFYPHKDGSAVTDRYGNNALVFLENIEHYYLSDLHQYDVVVLNFRAAEYVELTGEYIDRSIVDDTDTPIIDDTNQEIWDDL